MAQSCAMVFLFFREKNRWTCDSVRRCDRKGRPYEQIQSFSEGKYLHYALCIMHYAFSLYSAWGRFQRNLVASIRMTKMKTMTRGVAISSVTCRRISSRYRHAPMMQGRA